MTRSPEIAIGDGVIRLNTRDENVRPYWSGTISGGLGGPGVNVYTEARPQAPGNWSTDATEQANALALTGLVAVSSAADHMAARNQLMRAFSIDDRPLTVYWPNGPATTTVRRDGRVEFDPRSARLIRWSATVVADDPAWYAGEGAEDFVDHTVRLPFTTGGLVFPATFPVTISETSSTGDLPLTLAAGGLMRWRIEGPAANPQVTTFLPDGTRRVVRWDLTLDAGEWLEVDVAAKQSKLVGQASRPPTIRQWPLLQSGLNLIQFRAAYDNAEARLVVSIREAL